MAVDRGFVDRNRVELERLRRVAAAVTDADLALRVENGWTVAAVFAHLAFWDRQRLELLRYWAAGGEQACVYPGDVFNAALLPLILAVPPREAVRSAVEAAEGIADYIAAMSDEAITAVLARPNPPPLERAWHWEGHLDQIDRALARAGRGRG